MINHLPAGHYCGLDVIPERLAEGRRLIGPELLAKKQPRLDVISHESVVSAAAFRPTFVYSNAVMIHVHPDELEPYVENLKRIAATPGTRVALNAKLAIEPYPYNNLGWAWPLEEIVARFFPLELTWSEIGPPRAPDGVEIRPGLLEFRRTGSA